jgi:hypothetical protein
LLHRLIWKNPTDGRAYVFLAGLWETLDPNKAAEWMILGERIEPMRVTTRLTAAAFWTRHKQLEKAIDGWSTALELRPEIRKEFYPLLLQLADDPQTRPAFQTLLTAPPSWWSHFFDYAARSTQHLDTLRTLYGWRQLKTDESNASERRAFIKRLERENRWQEAYFVWINSLNQQQLDALGNIYNGSFELPLSDEGFGWRIFDRPGISITTGYTYGINGGKALHVIFSGKRIFFRHIFQYLFLTPGHYQLQGLVRPERLRLARGLQWKLRCLNQTPVLAVSERFIGSGQWRSFNSDFQIPEKDCRIQQLRLEMMNEEAFAAQGEIWFDDLRIKRQDH